MCCTEDHNATVLPVFVDAKTETKWKSITNNLCFDNLVFSPIKMANE